GPRRARGAQAHVLGRGRRRHGHARGVRGAAARGARALGGGGEGNRCYGELTIERAIVIPGAATTVQARDPVCACGILTVACTPQSEITHGSKKHCGSLSVATARGAA